MHHALYPKPIPTAASVVRGSRDDPDFEVFVVQGSASVMNSDVFALKDGVVEMMTGID